MTDDELNDFRARRRVGLGGSDLGAILGLNPWKTPFQVWQEKTGRVDSNLNSLQMRFGTYAEEFVAQEYTRVTGRSVQRFNAMLRHETAPLLGHLDRLVIPPGEKIASHKGVIRTDRLMDCKTASAFAAGRSDEWGPSGSDQMPESYLCQCAAYLALTGCQYADLAVLFGNQEFRVYTITRDLELEAMLLRESTAWWERHVVADVPPEPCTELEARQRWSSHRHGVTVTLNANQTAEMRALLKVKQKIKELAEHEQRMKDRLIPYFADAEQILGPDGAVAATYKSNRPTQTVNWMRLACRLQDDLDMSEAERDALYHEYTEITPGARVLRLKLKPED